MSKFISIEGVEGAGKSTSIGFIQSWFSDKNIPLVCTREPGGTIYAEKIRELLLSPNIDEPLTETAELLLIFAARAQHLSAKIRPELKAGNWVLTDRFTDATYAYQGYGRGLNLDTIAVLEQLVQQHLQPDLTIILDLPVEVGLARARQRGELDRFEQEKADFFVSVQKGYHERAKQDPDRVKLIDASVSIAEVQSQIAILLAREFKL